MVIFQLCQIVVAAVILGGGSVTKRVIFTSDNEATIRNVYKGISNSLLVMIIIKELAVVC